jgi:hypothetical protein
MRVRVPKARDRMRGEFGAYAIACAVMWPHGGFSPHRSVLKLRSRMSSFIPAPASWPFAPGESPFAIKGTAYKGHLEYVATHVPGGIDAMRARFTDERLVAFFDQAFLASSLYDLYPLVIAAEPCGALMGMSAMDFAGTRARDQAPKDLGGVYRFLLSMVPTGSVARRLPQLLTQVFNFGSTTVLEDAPGYVRAQIEGLPEALAPWMSVIMSAYGEAALRTSGARDATFWIKPGEPMGHDRGVRIVRSAVEVRFR